MMLKLPLIVLLIVSLNSFGQNEKETVRQTLEQKGMRLISDTDLSEAELKQLIAFDFETYRNPNSSIIIKVVEGPHLELFSLTRIETGEVDKIEQRQTEISESEQNSSHEHIPASEKVTKKLQIRVVDVFGTKHK